MSGGELSGSENFRLKDGIQRAETMSGLKFSVFLGASSEDPRATAEELHDRLADPDRSVLVLCDPQRRALEIVTGALARRSLSDEECRLVALSMQSNFIAGDLIGGLSQGLAQLGDSARKARILHVTES